MSELRKFSISPKLEQSIWNELKNRDCDPNELPRIRESIVRLSDHFISQKAKSPFHDKWAQIGYLAYYFPLNYLRAQAVCQEASRLGFFEGLKTAVDIGSGFGSLTQNLIRSKNDWSSLHSIDVSQAAIDIQRSLLDEAPASLKLSAKAHLLPHEKFDLACLSYSWNEFSPEEKNDLLSKLENFQALMIIEPSTQIHARRLMELRSELLKRGFYAWGPCTHQADCPLLVHSKTDWCHDRIGVERSPWQASIEKLLPFKNESLTFSYLLMKRIAPQFRVSENYEPARIIGDELVEKGKNRQAICRSDEREFLAWFPQRLKHNIFSYIHGEFVELNKNTSKKSNELRINENDIIKKKS